MRKYVSRLTTVRDRLTRLAPPLSTAAAAAAAAATTAVSRWRARACRASADCQRRRRRCRLAVVLIVRIVRRLVAFAFFIVALLADRQLNAVSKLKATKVGEIFALRNA